MTDNKMEQVAKLFNKKLGEEFAMTLIYIEKLPNSVSFDSLRWLVGQGRKLKNE